VVCVSTYEGPVQLARLIDAPTLQVKPPDILDLIAAYNHWAYIEET
jgi:hypothetical protein